MKELVNKKIAIFGGSFNPVHTGHMLSGFEVIERLGYDYILYIPDNIPVHKDFSDAASASHRMNMLRLAIKDIKFFGYSDFEIKRGGLTYTIDTVKELKKKIDFKYKFGIIMGDDLVKDLYKWKDVDELNRICDLICLFRNGKNIIDAGLNITWVKNRIIEVSSTEIRNRVRKGLPIDYLVCEDVKKYIFRKKLYRDTK